jgi:2-methylcitrate dehydratase PrpD
MTEDRYSKLAIANPVNKQAAVVTSQTDCDDNIFLTADKDILKALGSQKRLYADKIIELKKKIGIRPSRNNDTLPRYILAHPAYQVYVNTKEKLAELDIKINHHRSKMKPKENTFESEFVTLTKEKYPNIFDEIKNIIAKSKQGKVGE